MVPRGARDSLFSVRLSPVRAHDPEKAWPRRDPRGNRFPGKIMRK
jgi:hypothetical protein